MFWPGELKWEERTREKYMYTDGVMVCLLLVFSCSIQRCSIFTEHLCVQSSFSLDVSRQGLRPRCANCSSRLTPPPPIFQPKLKCFLRDNSPCCFWYGMPCERRTLTSLLLCRVCTPLSPGGNKAGMRTRLTSSITWTRRDKRRSCASWTVASGAITYQGNRGTVVRLVIITAGYHW